MSTIGETAGGNLIVCDDDGNPEYPRTVIRGGVFWVITEDQPLERVRLLITAWDRAQGALPELPQGYVVEADYEDWLAWSPRDLLLADTADKTDAIAACWAHYAATLDPKWAQLLRNAGLPV